MAIEQNVARSKAVTELLELGEALCRDGGWDIVSFWELVSIGAANRAGETCSITLFSRKESVKSSVDDLSYDDLMEPTRLTDDDRMLWGKYKDERLGDIPDDYWQWFLKQDWCDNWPDLVEYANVIDKEGGVNDE